jgi:GNAT superfamily N-acetyltransferase
LSIPTLTSDYKSPSGLSAVACSAYSYEELADIYNQTRIDYIVPMPMNAKRMREYVEFYDVNLEASVVSINSNDEPTGVCMVGFRGNRGWITRLGVIPEKRLHGNGQFLMETAIHEASIRNISRIQLEVIKGNAPAHKLFSKLGFEEARDLLVIRRPPVPLPEDLTLSDGEITPLTDDQIPVCLTEHNSNASWLDEAMSLLNAGNLKGYQIEMPCGVIGWVIFQCTPFQLGRFAFKPNLPEETMLALLYHIHQEHPMRDTKIENIPAASRCWPVYQQMNYMEVFARIEMYLYLS